MPSMVTPSSNAARAARSTGLRHWLPAAIRGPLFGALADIYPQLDNAPRFLRARHTFRELSSDSVTGYFWNLSVVGSKRTIVFGFALDSLYQIAPFAKAIP